MYNVWMRNYPQADVNITEEWNLQPFFTLRQANTFINDLETMYANSDWHGHPMYRAKFYAQEESA